MLLGQSWTVIGGTETGAHTCTPTTTQMHLHAKGEASHNALCSLHASLSPRA
jgi:hypothetical protein